MRDAFGVTLRSSTLRDPPRVRRLFAASTALSKCPRCPSPAATQSPRIVHHEKERRHRDPMFASSPAPRRSVGRGHRRGLDGPSMPRPHLKIPETLPRECCLPANHARHGEAGDSSQRSKGGAAPQAGGGHERRRVPRLVVPYPASPANRSVKPQTTTLTRRLHRPARETPAPGPSKPVHPAAPRHSPPARKTSSPSRKTENPESRPRPPAHPAPA